MTKNMNYDEIKKLDEVLTTLDIPHVFTTHMAGYGYHIFYPSMNNCKCSVISTPFSYGAEYGLLEIMGLLTDEEKAHDSVMGYLTAEDVAKRIIEDHLNSVE